MFIVLEGGEGAGKSTLAETLRAGFLSAGREAIAVREPGSTATGTAVRALLHGELTPWAETFAFLLARAQLIAEVIAPALEAGTLVICDRFEASTFAYQGYGRGLDLRQLRTANAFATGGLHPDLTIYLDIDPRLGLQRKRGESEAIRTGLEALAFHDRVRAGYRLFAEAAAAGQWLTLDATLPAAEIAARAWEAIGALNG